MIDRLTAFENMIFYNGYSWLEGKVAGFIAVGNESGGASVVSNLTLTLNSYGMLTPPWSFVYHTDRGDVLENRDVVIDAINVGRVVALAAAGERVSPGGLV